MPLDLYADAAPFTQTFEDLTRSTVKLARVSLTVRIDLFGPDYEPGDPEDFGLVASSIRLDGATARAMVHNITVHARPTF